MQRYLVQRLRKVLQPFSITRLPAVDMDDSEEPKSKRPRVEDAETREDAGGNGGTEEGKEASPQAGPRFAKRRKCVLLMAYNGKGYMGMQKNPGVHTIEDDLLDGLAKAGAFPEEMKDNMGKLKFQRCARTDKGVSAARQVVSIKALVPRVNSYLPDVIRIIALKRVTKGFDSRHICNARTYEYLLPTYAFAPYRLTTVDYRIDDVTVAKVNQLLGQYVGTHNFHNFTSGTKFEQMASNRYIMSFECGKPFLAQSTCRTCQEDRKVEFMTLKVKGQSFMIHQIRKMIGLVIAIVRGRTEEGILQKAYSKEKVDIPRVPGLGLLLENVHFERYNNRVSGDGIHELLDWTPFDEEVEKFKRDKIHQSIIDTEIDEMSMSQWLGSLQIHNFNQTATRLKEQQQKQQQHSTTIAEAQKQTTTTNVGERQDKSIIPTPDSEAQGLSTVMNVSTKAQGEEPSTATSVSNAQECTSTSSDVSETEPQSITTAKVGEFKTETEMESSTSTVDSGGSAMVDGGTEQTAGAKSGLNPSTINVISNEHEDVVCVSHVANESAVSNVDFVDHSAKTDSTYQTRHRSIH